MNWKKRLLYWFCEDFVSIDHLNVIMKEQYLARNSIVAHFDEKFIEYSKTLVKAHQMGRIGLQRIEDLKQEFEELDKISVGMQMERDTYRDTIESITRRIRKLEKERKEYGDT